jgi:hypothetical protein
MIRSGTVFVGFGGGVGWSFVNVTGSKATGGGSLLSPFTFSG